MTVVVFELLDRADRPTSTTPGRRMVREDVFSGVVDTEGERVDLAAVGLDRVTGLLVCALEEVVFLALTRDTSLRRGLVIIDLVFELERPLEDTVDVPRVAFVRTDFGALRSANAAERER